MRLKTASLLLSTAVVAAALVATFASQASGDKLGLDDLSTSKVGDFPKRWRTWPLQRDKAGEVYKVAEENGQRFIRGRDEADLSPQIFLNFNWPIEQRPILSWRWRATQLPSGASEASDATNDSACGVYVVIGKYSGHAIKYVWSSTLPVGQAVTRHDGKLKIKVLDSGPAKKGSWVSHSVDVAADYQELYGQALEKNPSGVGILTDGNATHQPAGCDYAGFAISSKEGTAK